MLLAHVTIPLAVRFYMPAEDGQEAAHAASLAVFHALSQSLDSRFSVVYPNDLDLDEIQRLSKAPWIVHHAIDLFMAASFMAGMGAMWLILSLC